MRYERLCKYFTVWFETMLFSFIAVVWEMFRIDLSGVQQHKILLYVSLEETKPSRGGCDVQTWSKAVPRTTKTSRANRESASGRKSEMGSFQGDLEKDVVCEEK